MEKGFISGYPDGRFKPANPITRAELVSLVNKSFGFVETKSVDFKDVAASNWVYPEVLKANAAGYISGYGNGSFGPGNKVTRQELAVIVSKLLGLAASADANFSDTADNPAWCKDAIRAVQEKGIMQGFADNSFHPGDAATRAEAVVILDRALDIHNSVVSVTYST